MARPRRFGRLETRARDGTYRRNGSRRRDRRQLARALGEHEILLRESGAEHYLRKDGWISIYRSGRGFAALEPELELGATLGVTARKLDPEAARALEPSLNPVFRHAIHWPDIA